MSELDSKTIKKAVAYLEELAEHHKDLAQLYPEYNQHREDVLKVARELNPKRDNDCQEFADIIFDTLMQNTQYPQLDLEDVESPEVDKGKGTIVMDYKGKTYQLLITEFDPEV